MILRLYWTVAGFPRSGAEPTIIRWRGCRYFYVRSSRKPGTVSEQVGVARILVRDGNGFDRIVEMPALNFVVH